VKISKNAVNIMGVMIVTIMMSGCSAMKSSAESAMEVPSLENQANRIVVGMGMVRTNSVIGNMPISADATWPEELNDDLVFEDNKQIISDALDDDPYVATHEYTDLYQKTQLGGFTFLSAPRIGNLTYSALNRAIILYGPKEENWPTFFDIATDLSTFHKFKDGTLKQVEATNSNTYKNLDAALISLMPINYQKDLEESRLEMLDAFFAVAELKSLKGTYETQIETNENPIEDENGSLPEVLSEEEILDLRQKTLELDTTISEKEIEADEKEKIHTSLLEEATEVLKNDIDISEEQVALAKNIILASAAIKKGALEAGSAFAVTTTILATTDIVQDFQKELETLAIAKIHIPSDLQDTYDQRIVRLGKNGLYSLPAIAIGTYYAIKQAYLAEQYETIAEIIVEADALEKEMQRNKLIDEENARNKLAKEKNQDTEGSEEVQTKSSSNEDGTGPEESIRK